MWHFIVLQASYLTASLCPHAIPANFLPVPIPVPVHTSELKNLPRHCLWLFALESFFCSSGLRYLWDKWRYVPIHNDVVWSESTKHRALRYIVYNWYNVNAFVFHNSIECSWVKVYNYQKATCAPCTILETPKCSVEVKTVESGQNNLLVPRTEDLPEASAD